MVADPTLYIAVTFEPNIKKIRFGMLLKQATVCQTRGGRPR